jgi:hypothetical protein
MNQNRTRWAIYNLKTFILFAPVNTKGVNVVVSRRKYFNPKDEENPEFILLEIYTTKLDHIRKHLSEKLLGWYITNVIYNSQIHMASYSEYSDFVSKFNRLFDIGKKLIENNEQRIA